MNFVLVFSITVFLQMKFAIAYVDLRSLPFDITRTPPTQHDIDANGDAGENPFYPGIPDTKAGASGATQHSDSTTTPMPLTTNAALSPIPTEASTTANITVLPETLTTRIMKSTQDIIKQNRRNCNKLQTDQLRSTCRTIVEESFQDNDYVYVVTDDDDLRGLKRHLVKRGVISQARTLDSRPMKPGDQSNCKSLTCPTTKDWLRGAFENERSTSPWIFCGNYDPNRNPAYIDIAKCRCKGCKDRSMEGENSNYVSREIKRQMRVMRKDKSLKHFSACTSQKLCPVEYETISVGCHCIVPVIKA